MANMNLSQRLIRISLWVVTIIILYIIVYIVHQNITYFQAANFSFAAIIVCILLWKRKKRCEIIDVGIPVNIGGKPDPRYINVDLAVTLPNTKRTTTIQNLYRFAALGTNRSKTGIGSHRDWETARDWFEKFGVVKSFGKAGVPSQFTNGFNNQLAVEFLHSKLQSSPVSENGRIIEEMWHNWALTQLNPQPSLLDTP